MKDPTFPGSSLWWAMDPLALGLTVQRGRLYLRATGKPEFWAAGSRIFWMSPELLPLSKHSSPVASTFLGVTG